MAMVMGDSVMTEEDGKVAISVIIPRCLMSTAGMSIVRMRTDQQSIPAAAVPVLMDRVALRHGLMHRRPQPRKKGIFHPHPNNFLTRPQPAGTRISGSPLIKVIRDHMQQTRELHHILQLLARQTILSIKARHISNNIPRPTSSIARLHQINAHSIKPRSLKTIRKRNRIGARLNNGPNARPQGSRTTRNHNRTEARNSSKDPNNRLRGSR